MNGLDWALQSQGNKLSVKIDEERKLRIPYHVISVEHSLNDSVIRYGRTSKNDFSMIPEIICV